MDEEEYLEWIKEMENKPEEVFEMITIIPDRKIKLVAHLEDPSGHKITFAKVATQLTSYIDEKMREKENNPINTQLMPVINHMMISAIPRQSGLPTAELILMSKALRYAVSSFGLQIALLMRYISQHDLKIVTEETPISDEELAFLRTRETEADENLRNALSGKRATDNSNDPNFSVN